MRGRWVAAVGVVILLVVHHISAHRVLFLGPISSKSHKNFYMGIVKSLADNGNEITIVTPYKSSKATTNVREVVVPDGAIENIVPNVFEGSMTGPTAVIKATVSLCSDTLGSENVQALLKEKFDIILISLFGAECFLSLAYQMQIPFAYVSPAGMMGAMTDVAGNPSFPSFVPLLILDYKHPMSFTERLINTVAEVATMAPIYLSLYFQDRECRNRGLCPADMPPITQMRYNSSLLVLNSVQVLENPARPYLPGIVHVGGIHCKPAQPLPQDLNEWVEENGDDGFIFFSLGSALQTSDLPEKYLQVLIKVFGSLKQRVLWKWNDDTLLNKPDNVRIGKWLPQQDILGHPKLRLFITHGGLHSTLESIYHGRPVLGIPVFGDQHTNLVEIERDGWGKMILWEDLNEEDLRNIIISTMEDKSMHEVAQQRAALMRDQPFSPSYQAVYWIEYVVRHNGAPHLRSPLLGMSWYQLYNVDVWLTVLVISLLLLYLTYRLLRLLCKLLMAGVRKVFFSKAKPKSE